MPKGFNADVAGHGVGRHHDQIGTGVNRLWLSCFKFGEEAPTSKIRHGPQSTMDGGPDYSASGISCTEARLSSVRQR